MSALAAIWRAFLFLGTKPFPETLFAARLAIIHPYIWHASAASRAGRIPASRWIALARRRSDLENLGNCIQLSARWK